MIRLCGDPDRDADTRIFKPNFYPSKLSTNSYKKCEGWNVAQVIVHSVLVLIWIMIRIQEYITEFCHCGTGTVV